MVSPPCDPPLPIRNVSPLSKLFPLGGIIDYKTLYNFPGKERLEAQQTGKIFSNRNERNDLRSAPISLHVFRSELNSLRLILLPLKYRVLSETPFLLHQKVLSSHTREVKQSE
jgi:hypothetical protein